MKSRIASNPPARKVASKNPKWIEPLEARIAPAVTIINVDSLAIDIDGDGKADPLDTIHYNVTVQNTGPGDITGMSFQDIINDPNLTLVNGSVNVSPLAIDDMFSAVGNTLLRVGGAAGAGPEVFVTSGSLTANDFEFLADTFTLTPIVNGASTQGGTVNVAADGTFTYIPAVDFTGTDSFTYTLRDDGIDGIAGNADDLTSTGTVTITVANKVWYIDSAAAPGGDGRSATPFNSLASLSGATGLDDPGDTIYVRERAGDYDGNLTLLANQKLIGSGVNLVIGSFTLATATSPTTIKTTAANTNAITLNAGNTVRGFSILDTTGAGILGANIGTLTIDNVSKTGSGKIIDLTGTTGNSATVTLDVATTTGSSSEAIRLANVNGTFTATTGAISGVSGTDILISGGSAAVTIGSSITGNTGGSIEVANHATGNITFSGELNITGGTGIHVHDNASGTIAFTNASKVLNTGAGAAVNLQTNGTATIDFSNGGLNIDTTTGAGFTATGGGTVTVTGSNNSINSVSAVALNVSNTNIGAAGLNFHDISAGNNTAATDPANGIVLNNTGTTVGTHGSLIISGDGVTTVGGNSSGGTIQSVFGAGISLTSTLSPSFTNLRILNTGGSGIAGTTTTNFTLKNSTISFSGNSLGAETSNIAFNTTAAGTERNLSGTVTITGNVLTSAYYHGVDIFNFNGTISNADISGNTISSSTSTANSKGHGIRLIAFGSASTVANVTKASLSNNVITGFPSGAGIMAQGGNANSIGGPGLPGTFGVANSATGDIISITGNRIAGYSVANRMGTQGILAVVNGYGQGNFDITGNGTVANPITNITGTAIAVSSLGFANVTANVNNNVIVANNTAGAQGIGAGTSRTFSAADTPNLTVKINNNRISQTDGNGILVTARDATGTVAAEINFNNVSAPLTGFRNGIRVDAGNALSANDRVFLEISNNTTTGNASSPEGIGLRKEGFSSTVNVFAIRGLTATASPNVENYVNSQNPASANGTLLISADTGFTNWTGGPGQPPLIPLIFAPEAPPETGGNEPDGEAPVGGNENPTETPVVTPPSGETTPVIADDGVLSQPELDALVAAAIARWEAAGLTAEQSALLHSVTFTVADLPGWYLGSASDGGVTLDIDGAGNGWFVDSSPLDDSEFANIGGSLTATINGGAKGHLDALTTIMHEFGHVLGLDDSYAAADSKNLMYGSLHLNERRLPTANQADGAVPHAHEGADFLFGPLSLGGATLPAGKSITIVYDQTVNSTINANQATSQISFTSSAGTVLSDDPSIAGANNPTVTQLDKPDVTVAIGATSSALENSGNTFTYTFTRQGPTTDAWTANFNVAGTALSSDYSIGTQSGVTFDSGTGIGSVTFAAGQSTATVVVTITGDNIVEANETVIVNLTSGANYDVATPSSATGTITNDDAATISISGGTVVEGDSGTANLPFTITLSNPVDVATTVQFSTANGTALAPGDYTAQSVVTVTIPAGETSVTQNVLVNGDTTVELDETVSGSIGSLSAGGRNVTLGTSSTTSTITNNDAATASISVGSVTEGNSGTVNLPFTVTLTKPVDVATTFQFSTADITAIAGSDYVAQSGVTITIPAGQLSVTQNVVVNGDNIVELNETYSGSIASPSASGRAVALGTTTSATATITNDDTATISVSAGTITEGNSGTANLPFTVTLTNAVDVDTVVQFSTADITALAGSDYVAQSGVTLTIPAGQLSVTQNVVVNGDNTVELTETFSGSISGLSVGGRGVTVATAIVTGTITNDDSATVSLMGGTIVEGNSGATNLPFTVILSNPVDVDTVVEFTTEDGTAQAGSDYVGQSLVSITIPAGQTSVTKNVTINGDNLVELNETFTATVGVVSNGGRNVNGGSTVATSQIANDDAATVSITGGTITEGNSGTANLPFTITLSNPVDVATTVEFSITGGTASGVTDYVSQAPIIITIPAGQTSVTHNVVVNGDNLVELDETITASIGSLGNNGRAVSLGTTSATGTIANDDTSVITITGFNVSEGNSGTANLPFVITLSKPVDVDTTVQFSTADLTAVAPGDYTAESLVTVTIPAGQTIVTHHVSVNGDSVVEGDETVTGSLSGLASSGRSVTLGTASSNATIFNDDAEATLVVTPGSVLEDGTQTLVYTFTRTGFTAAPLTVNFNVDGTATFNTDYMVSSSAGFSFGSTTGTVTFATNSSTASITVDPTADTSGETDETVSLTLATGAGYTIGTGNNATGTILDDDTKVSIAVAPGSIGENSGSNLLYTFTRTGDTTLPLTVNFTYDGNATFGTDYNQTGAATFAGGVGTIIIPAGQSSAQVSLGVLNDKIVEGTETAVLSVAVGSGYGVDALASATGTIDDNDFATISIGNPGAVVVAEEFFDEVTVFLNIFADGVLVPGEGSLGRDVTINVQDLLTGTATPGGSDYSFTAVQTITFAAGDSGFLSGMKSVPITFVNDERVEGSETINFQLNNLVDGTGGHVTLGGSFERTVIINDNDKATISLASSSSNVGEANGTHNVGVTLVITANGVVGAGTLERNITVNLQDLLTGTATSNEGGDYGFPTTTTLTFASGESSSTKNATIGIANDIRVEGNETINLQLNGLNDGTSGQVSLTGSPAHTVTINDNDFATISLANGSTTVGEGGGSHNIGVVLTITANGVVGSGTLDRNVTVNLADLLTGTATVGGSDYNLAALSTLTFAAGESGSTKNVSIGLVNDARVEGSETINLQLNGLSDGTGGQVSLIGSPAHTVTITDNDFATISLAPNLGIISENVGSHSIGVVLTITADGTGTATLDRAVTVNFADLLVGSATSGADYTYTSPQTVSFGVGSTNSTQNVAIAINDDTRVEGAESASFQLNSLSDGTNGQVTFGTFTGQGLTILDNDTATISFTQGTSTAGEGVGNHNVGITLVITANGVVGSGSLERDVTVRLTDLLLESASAGVDYNLTSPQTITFASGAEGGTQNVVVGVVNDARVEGDETINLHLGTLGDPTEGQVSLGGTAHVVTIRDNDTATISLANATSIVGEAAGTHNVGVTLVINADGTGPATLERSISVNLQDLLTGTATSNEGGDYGVPTTTTLTFESGESASTKNVTIGLVNDTRVEGNETINLQLNGLNDGTSGQVSLTGSPAHTVTITDNDFATISLANGATTVGEDNESHNISVVLTITANGVTGSGTLDRNVTVNLADLLTGTATAGGSDYNLAALSTLTFAAGESGSTKSVNIGLVNDERVEGDETIKLELNGLNDGTAGQVSLVAGSASHTVTVTDNDFATISLAPQNGLVNENAGSHNIGVVLTITANNIPGTGTLDRAVSVNLADLLVPGATSGSDYTFNSPQTVSFGVGASSSTQNVAIGITDDTRVEGNESLGLELKGLNDGTNGQVALGNLTTQLLSIVDNDTATISFVNATSTVGEAGGNHNVGVTLVITANGVAGDGTLERPISVALTDLLTGTAVAPGDYTLGTPQTITFASGDASSTKNVVIGVIDDNASEGNETINLQLGSLNDPTEGQVSLVQSTGHAVTITDNDIDLVVTKTGPTTPVIAGSGAGNLTYVITVTNAGLTNATGVVLSEDLTLVPGVSIVSITPSVNGGTFDLNATPDGIWTLGNLSAGESATLTVVLTVGSSTAAGTNIISDTATVTASNEVRINVGNDSASASTSIDRLVDLGLAKTDGLTTTTPGSLLTYTLNVTNSQPSDANGVVLTETVPVGTTFNAAASSAGWVETSPGVYTLNLGTVAGNSSAAPVTFAVTVNSSVPAGLHTIANTASLADDGSLGGDSTPLNNTAIDTNTLEATPDLVVAKTVSPATLVRGGLVTYSITYSNVGNQAASGVHITEHLPSFTTFQAAGSTVGWTSSQAGNYDFFIAEVAAGASATITFQVRVDSLLPGGTTKITNTVDIGDDAANGVDLTPANNTSTVESLLYQGIYVVSPGVALPRKGAPADVRVFDIATGEQLFQIPAYEATYRDSVRIAVGDINGDGYDDIITSTRTGTGRVRVFDGVTGEQFGGALAQIDPFDGKKHKGAFVASGDVNGDGHDDIVVGSARGGGEVKVYSGVDGSQLTSYTPFGKKFRGGVKVAVGDVNGDGIADIIAGQGLKGSTVKVFSGSTENVLEEFKIGPGKYRGGVNVAAADLDGDNKADIIVGRNNGKPSQFEIISGVTGQPIGAEVLPFGAAYRLGVRVAAADVNLDGVADIIAAVGGRGGSQVKIFDGVTKAELTEYAFAAFPDYPNSALFVAGSSPVPSVPQIVIPNA